MNQINFNHFTSLYATISFLKHISPDASFHKMIHFSRVFIASYLRMLPVSRLKRSESNIGQFWPIDDIYVRHRFNIVLVNCNQSIVFPRR